MTFPTRLVAAPDLHVTATYVCPICGRRTGATVTSWIRYVGGEEIEPRRYCRNPDHPGYDVGHLPEMRVDHVTVRMPPQRTW